MPSDAPIPVYRSRHTPGITELEGYGAHIAWEPGERVLLGRTMRVPGRIVDPQLKWHDDAPEIDSARGQGRWVIEVEAEGETSAHAASAAQVFLP